MYLNEIIIIFQHNLQEKWSTCPILAQV